MAKRVSDSEKDKVLKLAARKGGVTKAQVAKAVGSANRAASVLRALMHKLSCAALGAKAGKACRTLVYYAK
ncbi:MAG: hypothetical protein IT371_30845 [Deltaproteobacteria bacterium]|nr:hypothetical protein [Deltaproteobacteria bacterium]